MISFRKSDLIDKLRGKRGIIGLPLRIVFGPKPGFSGKITAEDDHKIYFETNNGFKDWRYTISAEVIKRDERAYYITDREITELTGYKIFDLNTNKQCGKITEIKDGFIYTDANKKIESSNYGMKINDISREIAIFR